MKTPPSIVINDFKGRHLKPMALSKKEYHFFETLPSLKKRSFLLGRNVAKKAIKNVYPHLEDKDISILNNLSPENKGQPFVEFPKHPHLAKGYVSISHRNELAAAIYDLHNSVGIDIDLIETRDPSFEDFVFSQQEKEALPKHPLHRKVIATTLWTAKEVLSKIVSKGLSLSTDHIHISIDPLKAQTFACSVEDFNSDSINLPNLKTTGEVSTPELNLENVYLSSCPVISENYCYIVTQAALYTEV